MIDNDYIKFCSRCGWNDSDYGCTSPVGTEVYQCPMYIHYHPDKVAEFNKACDEYCKGKRTNE